MLQGIDVLLKEDFQLPGVTLTSRCKSTTSLSIRAKASVELTILG